MVICCSLVAAGNADLVTATEDQLQQRKLFIQAEKALQKNNREKFEQLKAQLTDYPLYPYLLYDDLMQRLPTLPNDQIQAFIDTYPASPLSKQLYQRWIDTLAEHNEWQTLTAAYRENLSGTEETCHYLSTQLMLDHTDIVDEKLPTLWRVGYSQPDPCDPVFEYGLGANKIDTVMIWERILLTLDKYNADFVEYLIGRLPDDEQEKATTLLAIYKNPAMLTEITLDDDPHFNRQLLYYATLRLARSNPEHALTLLKQFQDRITLSEKQTTRIHTLIRDAVIRKGPEHSVDWLYTMELDNVLPIVYQWQLQNAIADQDWPTIITLFEKLPDHVKRQSKWRYWYARSLQQTHPQEANKANDIFKTLASERHYYGFLAAYQLQQSLPIENKPLHISKDEYQAMIDNPHIQKAYELYALKRNQEGDIEWKLALQGMTAKERYNAARIAAAMHWPQVALLTTRTFAYRDDLSLRFPILYQPLISKLAKKYQIPAALIFAMIRQESAYRPDAVSVSGALGLMQLMPRTAVYIAEKIHHKKPSREMLYDPTVNITLGSAYVDYLFSEHAEHPLVAIASYNAGPNRVKRWLPKKEALPADVWVETIPWQEPRNYVKRVFTYTMIYQHLLGKKYTLDDFLRTV